MPSVPGAVKKKLVRKNWFDFSQIRASAPPLGDREGSVRSRRRWRSLEALRVRAGRKQNLRGSRGIQGAAGHSQRGEDSDILRSPRMVALRLQYPGAQNCRDGGCGRSSGSRRPVWRTARPHLPGTRLRGVYHRRGSPRSAGSASVSHAYAHVVDFGREIELGGVKIRSGDLLEADLHGILCIPPRRRKKAARAGPQSRSIPTDCRSNVKFSLLVPWNCCFAEETVS
jgi:hypothetical protein